MEGFGDSLDGSLSLMFVPSPQDIADYDGPDSYGCGLGEVQSEVDGIVDELTSAFYNCEAEEERKAIPSLHRPIMDSAGYMPELFIQLGVLLSSGTISVLFYKLIENWIKHRNGRKFRVRLPSGFEVEASQLSEKDFARLFHLLYEKYNSRQTLSPRKLRREGFEILDEDKQFDTRMALRDEYDKKCTEISGRNAEDSGA